MTGECPPGTWGKILVGQFWTPQSDLTAVSVASAKRKATSVAWQSFSDQLHQTLSGPISPEIQKGASAERIRQMFQWSADQADNVAETNDIISKAHSSGHNSAAELNSQLATIAQNGDARIKEIQDSRDPVPIKAGKIAEVVVECQQQATTAAALCAQNIFEAMQMVLAQRHIPKSSRQFVNEFGMDPARMFGSPNEDTIRQHVQSLVNRAGSAAPLSGGPASSTKNPPLAPVGDNRPSARMPVHAPVNEPSTLAGDNRPPTLATTGVPASQSILQAGDNRPWLTPGTAPATTPTATPPTASPPVSTLPTALPPAGPTNLAPNLVQASAAPTAGAPVSPATGALAATPTTPQLPQTPPMAPQASPPPTAMAPVFETPPPAAHIAPPEAAPAIPPAAAPTPAYVAPPSAPAPLVGASPPLPPGALPTYGADIRPPTAAVSTAAPPAPTAPAGPPSAAVPATAPANLQAGAGAVATSTPRQPPPPSPAAAVSGQMAVATTGGAITGAAAGQATAQARLQRLVDFVARQQPRLSWATGEHRDGTTVLVTDLASGWLPPGIEIPSGTVLLDPAHRRGDLESLLGEVSVTASYTRLHYLPPAGDSEPVSTSARARQGSVVEELGWKLGQATKWRDGLPRLAHTLAKAGSTGTGVLDSEVDLLRENLVGVADQVLDSYPDEVDAAALGNWQLLATIDALIAEDKTAAHYHFAWFEALKQL